MLLIWLVYYFLATSQLIKSVHKSYPIEYHIWYSLEFFITLLSVIFNVYYNKVKKTIICVVINNKWFQMYLAITCKVTVKFLFIIY